jgi:NAD(P)-dependent dehydrogenase (short-subunit alcohol dehydrogenase family)
MNVNGSALVTGTGRGLGRAIALELAARGVQVLAGVRDPALGEALERLAAPLPGCLRAQQLDLTSLGDYVPPADLGILVNNAGFRGRYRRRRGRSRRMEKDLRDQFFWACSI